MTPREAYIYMLATLQTYWDLKHDVEVGDLLSGLDLSWYKDENPSDPAYWHDWTKALQSVARNDLIDDKTALKATIALLDIYKKQGFELREVTTYLETRFKHLLASYNTRRINTPSGAPRHIKGA